MRAKQEEPVVMVRFRDLKGEMKEAEVLNRGIIEHIINALSVEEIAREAIKGYKPYSSDGVAYIDIRTGELKSGKYDHEKGYDEEMQSAPCVFLAHVTNYSQEGEEKFKKTEPFISNYLYWVWDEEIEREPKDEEYFKTLARSFSRRLFSGSRVRDWRQCIREQLDRLYFSLTYSV